MSCLARYDAVECRIIQRRSRFSVSVTDGDGRERLAHLANSGRLLDLVYPGNVCVCIPRVSAKTTLRLIAASSGRDMILLDPAEQSRAFEAAAARGLIPWLDGWRIDRREVTVGDSRIDFSMVSESGRTGFLELKSAAMLIAGDAGSFPDCPTTRGQKHLAAMRGLAARHRSVILFVVTHPSARLFTPNASGDPVFASGLAAAAGCGLEVRAVKISLEGSCSAVLRDAGLPCVL